MLAFLNTGCVCLIQMSLDRSATGIWQIVLLVVSLIATCGRSYALTQRIDLYRTNPELDTIPQRRLNNVLVSSFSTARFQQSCLRTFFTGCLILLLLRAVLWDSATGNTSAACHSVHRYWQRSALDTRGFFLCHGQQHLWQSTECHHRAQRLCCQRVLFTSGATKTDHRSKTWLILISTCLHVICPRIDFAFRDAMVR